MTAQPHIDRGHRPAGSLPPTRDSATRMPDRRGASAHRWIRPAIGLGFLLAQWLALPAPQAWAHATLLATSPPAGFALPTAPTQLSLDFDEPVTIGSNPLTLETAAGAPQALGPARLTQGDRRLTAAVPSPLAAGGYRVTWQVAAGDGDPVAGVFTFAVGSSPVPTGQTAANGSPDSPIMIIARWALFAGLAMAGGGAVGETMARRVARRATQAGATVPGQRPLLLSGALLGAAAAAILAWQGSDGDVRRLVDTPAGRLAAAELLGFAVAAIATAVSRRRVTGRRYLWTGVSLLVWVAVAEALRAHPHQASPVLGTALTVVHLAAAAVWIGTLLHVLLVARRWRTRPAAIRLLVYNYARLALWLVAAVVVTGAAEAVVLLPSPAALVDSAYGIALSAKLLLVAGAVALADRARRRRRGDPPTVLRVAKAEIFVLVGVLAATALLVSLPTPAPVTTDLALPPPPVGPVVPAGTLAGQITVTATASAGQLIIRLAAPNSTDAPTPDFKIDARLQRDGSRDQLALRGCGTGCFTARASWSPGANQVLLNVAAPPWRGGPALLDVPWPPRTDPTAVPAMLAAMRAAPRITIHEAVSSNYTGSIEPDTDLHLSGPEFLGLETWIGNGASGHPVLLSPPNADVQIIGLSYPQNIVVRLYVDADHRILREETTTPSHLVISTFEYPTGAA